MAEAVIASRSTCVRGGQPTCSEAVRLLWRISPTLATDPRSAVLAEHGRPSRLRTTAVFHASRTPTRTLAHTLLTIERTCPAGAPAGACRSGGSCTWTLRIQAHERGFQTLRRLQFPIRHKAGIPPGGSSPRPEGPEGARVAVRRSRCSTSFLHMLRIEREGKAGKLSLA